jgi:hypothetical protein
VACAGFAVAPAPPLAKRRYLGTKVLRSDRYASSATSYLRTPDLWQLILRRWPPMKWLGADGVLALLGRLLRYNADQCWKRANWSVRLGLPHRVGYFD